MAALVAIHFSVIGEKQFPLAFNTPAIEETRLGLFDIRNVVSEALAKDAGTIDSTILLHALQQVQTWNILRNRNACCRQCGRKKVDRRDHFVTLSRFEISVRPRKHDGRPDATFIGRLLGPRSIGGTVGPVDPAVVGYIHDQGIVSNLLGFQNVDQFAHRFVEPFAIGIVLGNGHWQALINITLQ